MNAFMSESQQVFFLSAHTFIVLPAPSLPLSRPQSGCIVKSSCQEYEFAQILFCVMIVCEFFLLMMHTLKDLSGTCMVRLILLVC